jgi:[ribosomal protein S5]-alanine N-acetyltransferase
MSLDFHSPWVTLPASSVGFSKYLERSDLTSAVCMVVCLGEGGDLAGIVNLNEIVRGSYQRTTLGYAAFLPYAGQGYMSAGVAFAVRHAFEQLSLNRVEADIQPANTASLKLVERLGFRREGYSPGFIKIDGVWRDHERWAISKQADLSGLDADTHNHWA